MLPGRQLGESSGKGNVESGRLLCTHWTLQLAWAFSDSEFFFFLLVCGGFWFGLVFAFFVCFLFWFVFLFCFGFGVLLVFLGFFLGVFLLVFYFLYY